MIIVHLVPSFIIFMKEHSTQILFYILIDPVIAQLANSDISWAEYIYITLLRGLSSFFTGGSNVYLSQTH